MDPSRRDDPTLDKARAILGYVTAMIGVFPLLIGITWLLTKPDQGVRSLVLVLNGLVMVLGGFLPTRRSRFLGSNRAGLIFLVASAIWLVLWDQFIAGPLSPAPTPTSVLLEIPTLPATRRRPGRYALLVPTFVALHFVGLSVRDAASSAAWYERVLGLVRVQVAGPGDHHRGAAILKHEASGLLIGLIALRANPGEAFDEARTGLDHLELRVASRAELEAWAAHFDALGVVRSPIAERPGADILTFRDPDNIQLELYAPKDPLSGAPAKPGTTGP